LDLLGFLELGPVLVSSGTILAPGDSVDDGLVVASTHAGDSNLDVTVTNAKMETIGTAPLTLTSQAGSTQISFDEATRQILVSVIQDTSATSNDVFVARFACQ
jgi:hypothetical protein